MNWITLYITGRSDFREEVRRKLEHSKLHVMPGYIDSSAGSGIQDLYWLEESTDIRAVKLAIGSKLIWKYRLRFFDTLEAFQQSRNNKGRPVSLPKRKNTAWKRSARQAGKFILRDWSRSLNLLTPATACLVWPEGTL